MSVPGRVVLDTAKARCFFTRPLRGHSCRPVRASRNGHRRGRSRRLLDFRHGQAETHLSAAQQAPPSHARLPRPHVDAWWSQGAGQSPPQGPQAPDGLDLQEVGSGWGSPQLTAWRSARPPLWSPKESRTASAKNVEFGSARTLFVSRPTASGPRRAISSSSSIAAHNSAKASRLKSRVWAWSRPRRSATRRNETESSASAVSAFASGPISSPLASISS